MARLHVGFDKKLLFEIGVLGLASLEILLSLFFPIKAFYYLNLMFLSVLVLKTRKNKLLGHYLFSMLLSSLFSILIPYPALFPVLVFVSTILPIISEEFSTSSLFIDIPFLLLISFLYIYLLSHNLALAFILSFISSISVFLNKSPLNLLFSSFLGVILFNYPLRTVIFGFGISFLLSYTAFIFKALKKDGLFASLLVGATSFAVSPLALILIFFFYISAILLAKMKKISVGKDFKQNKPRDALQVYSNSFASILFFHIANISGSLPLAGIAAIAAATADTWATEIGMRFGKTPILITSFKPAPKGRSGAISFEGLLGSLFAGLAIFAISYPFYGISAFSPAVVGAVLGSLLDSFLGATLQALYKCRMCGKLTEEEVHHKVPALLYEGVEWIDNNVVNFLTTFVMGLIYL